ncbi:PQQ-binding-like beta-propeller repeat protein [Winogradskya humida]|uniref:WD-40 repeat-containing protein n=1 Tax=Winogradskya humida TaxID=113566 RepID=A0ABQ3ZXD6_9ACTN|nr:PQQ-binding-like beta-propeller repeat protein [Actinoplanes humidus]GIE22852.1 hypothetical protein Ahu01nite_059540 [Actinoplanes humidus]
MRPLLIAEVPLAAPRWVTHLAGGGWLAHHPEDRSATVLDADLRLVTRIDLPVTAQRSMVSVNEQHLAAVTHDELVVCDLSGTTLWRRQHTIQTGGLPNQPNCHLDTQGTLWVYLPDSDELVAYDPATGEEIDRARLDSSVGAAYFHPHPDRKRLGLHVAMGQDTPLNYLTWLADGRIQGRNIPGGLLAGLTTDGGRYLTLPHNDVPEISIRDLATGAIMAACDPAEVAGDSGYRLMEAAALVSDDFVLVAVSTDDWGDDFEDHLLLATRNLRRQADIDYGIDMVQNAITATDGRGRWLTGGRDATVRLWQLPDRVTDEIPGQLDLW